MHIDNPELTLLLNSMIEPSCIQTYGAEVQFQGG